jgi:hypothetical protein
VVDLARRREEEAARAAFPGREDRGERPAQRDVEDALGLLVEEARAVHGGEVEDGRAAARRPLHERFVTHVAVDRLELPAQVGEAVGPAARVVVEDADGTAARDKAAHQRRAEEAGAAGDERDVAAPAHARDPASRTR